MDNAFERARAAYGTGAYDDATLEFIFPQLKESEDERIRKWLYELIDRMSYDNLTEKERTKNEEWKKKVLDWLEKQKEEADKRLERVELHCKEVQEFDKKIKALRKEWYGEEQKEQDECPEYCVRSHCIGCSIYEKQKEQKPADDKAFEKWIDEWWKHNKVKNPDSYDKGDEIQFDKRGFKNFCRGIRNMYVEQKPAEWSEEDETMINHIIEAQPKVELTLLDKNIINAAVAFVELNPYNYWCGIDKRTVIKALRSLRPFWKPSEEQMEALKEVAYNLVGTGTNTDVHLVQLYEQLKQLYP